MLASKIEVFSKIWLSKRSSKFHRVSSRCFIAFGSVLASNLEPSWEPRQHKIWKKGFKNICGMFQEPFLRRPCFGTPFWGLLASILGGSWLDFLRFFADISSLLGRLWAMFSAASAGGAPPPQNLPLPAWSWQGLLPTRPSANFAKIIQELAEDKDENKSIQTSTRSAWP